MGACLNPDEHGPLPHPLPRPLPIEDCEALFEKRVWAVVPESLHEDYPNRLLACAVKVCASEPFGWTVDRTEPEISSDTTFRQICELWLMKVVWP